MRTSGKLVIVFLSILIFLTSASADPLTGKVANQPTNVSILIVPPTPILTIISPINGTYLTNESLLLEFTSTIADNYWYNLNNGPNQTTSLPGEYFNVSSSGSYTLYLFANRSGSIGFTSVTFNVNLTLFIILYDEYKGTYRGNSTDFYSYTYEQMFNMSNITLEHTRYGKIYFKDNITLPDDEYPNDGVLDLDKYTNISYNRIEVNASALPNFDVRATIWFYNLTFSNPRILKDGVLCSSCVVEDYLNGVLRISVSDMGVYTVEEIPAPIGVGVGVGAKTIARCKTKWICSDWTECINRTKTRKCQKIDSLCDAEYPRPPEEMECEIEIEVPAPPFIDCCICSICWFRFILCWYWWIIIIIAWLILRETRRYCKRLQKSERERLKCVRDYKKHLEKAKKRK